MSSPPPGRRAPRTAGFLLLPGPLLLLLSSLALADPQRDDYQALLHDVVRFGGVDYATLKARRDALDRFVASLAGADPGPAEPDHIAFWINAYNAITLREVLDTRPDAGPYSADQVPEFRSGPRWTVAGRSLSLDGIQNEVLRGEFRDPRALFALCRASRGSPALAADLYAGETLDVVLTERVRAYLGNEEQNRFDTARQHAEIGEMFLWFHADVSRRHAGEHDPLKLFLADFAPREAIARSLRGGEWLIRYRPFDGSLNEAGVLSHVEGVRGIGPLGLGLYLALALSLLLTGVRAFRGRPDAPGDLGR